MTGKDKEEMLHNATEDLKKLISCYPDALTPKQKSYLKRWLEFLHAPEDWQEDDAPASVESFADFLRFLIDGRPRTLPGLGLSYDGNIIASWTTKTARLTSEFKGAGNIEWVASFRYGNTTTFSTGESDPSNLRETLKKRCIMPHLWQ